MTKIAPSILSADFTKLGEEIKAIEKAGADYIHIDVMDGHFVPNITVGPMIVKAARKVTNLPLDVHLMIVNPERYIDDFVRAGSDLITVHVETVTHLHRLLGVIRDTGIKAGAALNPATPLSSIEHVLNNLDMVVLMTVNPGFGGQSFISEVLPKIEELKKMIDQKGMEVNIEVDGGINIENIAQVARAGANVFVAGNAIFGSQDYAETIALMREKITP
ncbi:MAG: ribulose-phosphate 3-epimerase [Deltaproteobacteria bacterium]|nr:ribulose-phosphate 3-epimerase [Deltaproteobacteria bacterium]MBW2105535.1 ribulose-phosphate 3-epimerase [Deltaproteobacteria bacterium]MBW2332303.1 ribulose-phosphate 3-epimerase [Deltaproteobacteria bacterium]RLB21096.1 MAG: ribulose-phosphate 3-epimerase [Deltaproteobacteria bacterium]RLJ03849.1 MAG: ribulose-phosphate 3-epimerase [Candidatus Aenigmarchaeota archaeon]